MTCEHNNRKNIWDLRNDDGDEKNIFGNYTRSWARSYRERLCVSYNSSTFSLLSTRRRLISPREIIYSAIYFFSLSPPSLSLFIVLLLFIARQFIDNKYLFLHIAFFPTFDPFFSTDSLAPTICAFSSPRPLSSRRIRLPHLFTSRFKLFVNATRMIYVSPRRVSPIKLSNWSESDGACRFDLNFERIFS